MGVNGRDRRVVMALALGVVAMLAACHGRIAGHGDDQRTAEGQVLHGSISDAMLPYDAVTSEPPLAPDKPSPGAKAATDSAEPAPADAASSATAPAESTAPPGAPPPE